MLGVTGLLLRRGLAQRGTVLTLVIVVAMVAGILAGAIGHTRAAAAVAVRTEVVEAEPTAAALRVQTRLAEDPAAQQAALERSLAELVPGVELVVSRELRSDPPTAVAVDDVELRLPLGDAGELTDDIVIDGALPAAGQVLLPVEAAAELGVVAGDVVTVGDEELEVSGVWAPADPEALRWFGEYLAAAEDTVTPGALLDAETLLDLVAAPFVLWTITPVPASLTEAGLAQLAVGAERVHQLLRNDDDVAVRGLTVTGELGETAAATTGATGTAAALGLVPIALLAVISLIALVQVTRLLWETRGRELEILIARGGGPGRLVAASTIEAAVISVLGAGLGTAVAAGVVASQDAGGEQVPAVVMAGLIVAVIALLVTAIVAAGQVRAVARRMAADRSGRARSATASATVVLLVVAAAFSTWQLRERGTVAAQVEPGESGVAIGAPVDPVTVLSLGALLAALAIAALALLGPLTRVVAAVSARSRGLTGALAGWQVSRRLRAYAVPVVLLVLAAGSVTTAAAFAGATQVQRQQVAALDVGTDVRIELSAGATTRAASPDAPASYPYQELHGVAAAGTARAERVTFGQLPVELLALDAGRIGDLVVAPAGLDLRAADALAAEPAGWPVHTADGTAVLELTARVSPVNDETVEEAISESERRNLLWSAAVEELDLSELGTLEEPDYSELGEATLTRIDEELDASAEARRTEEFEVEIELWLADRDGGVSLVEAGAFAATRNGEGRDGEDPIVGTEPVELSWQFELPAPGEYRLIGIDVFTEATALGQVIELDIGDLRGAGEDESSAGTVDPGSWALLAAEGRHPVEAETRDPDGGSGLGLRAVVEPSGASMSSGPPTRPAVSLWYLAEQGHGGDLPVVISRDLADAAALGVGGTGEILVGTRLGIEVVGVVDAIPGAPGAALLVDQQTLSLALLHNGGEPRLPTTVFATPDGTASLGDVVVGIEGIAGPASLVRLIESGGADSTASVRDAFWIAAAGSVLLALTGVTAVGLALARERRSEVMVLRALGAGATAQGRNRAAELLGVGAWGIGLGVGAGLLASWLLVETLARAASTRPSQMSLGGVFDVTGAAVLLLALAAGLLAVAAVVGARVRAQALDATWREEVR